MPLRNPERILERLDWTVIRRLDGLLQGDYRTLLLGSGLDLTELREYQFTDDVRYIDWNVTARMQTPYVRQYTEDRDITAWFLLDLSPSVDFGTSDSHKRDVLIDFVTVLSRILTRHGNRVGAIFYSGTIDRIIPSGSGRNQVLRLVNGMLQHPQLKQAPPTDLSTLLEMGSKTARRRSLVFVISDFMSVPGWEAKLGTLAQRHEIIAVRLYDPREVDLPDVGLIVMEDAETGEQMLVDTHSSGFRRRFQEAAQRREAELKAVLSRSGADLLELSTHGDLVKDIMRYAAMRKSRKQAPTASKPAVAFAAAAGGKS